jgi:hypothetical protein
LALTTSLRRVCSVAEETDAALLTDFLKDFKTEVEEEDIYGDGLAEENVNVEPKYMKIMVFQSLIISH